MHKSIDGLQLTEALQAMAREGFSANNQVRPGGRVRCGVCAQDSGAGAFAVLMRSRIEGVSDPDDENLVAGVRCPNCGALGALVLPYGSRVGPDEAEVLRLLVSESPAPALPN